MTETVLFVGGFMDGKVLNISPSVHTFNAHVPKEEGREVIETYHRQALHLPGMPGGDYRVNHSIFLAETESPDNLIPLLIEGYRRKDGA